MNLEIVKAKELKQKPEDEAKLGFGKIFTDHMLMMKYKEGKGWYEAQIRPFGDIALSPASLVFHYAQEVFEGMKAYHGDGKDLMFRPWDNVARMAVSAERLCMKPFDKDFVLNAIYELVRLERGWIPKSEGTSLYIRPTYIGVDAVLGVQPAREYLLFVILTPVGAYYESGLAPVSIYVEDKYVRSVIGHTGAYKTGGNYAASLLAGERAHEVGFSQVLWLDGRENKYIEEVGSMNIFFKINGELLTPPLLGSILPGITRDSIMKLARDMGVPVREERLSIQDVFNAQAAGTLEEVFGTGTAAVVSPVGKLVMGDKEIDVNHGEMGQLTQKLYDTLTDIQYGRREDKFGWVAEL